MAGTLVVSTLSDGTNSTSSTNAIRGSAKAWVTFVGSTGAIQSSFNVSSITVSGGNYTVNFTTAMPNANYSTFVSPGSTNTSGYTSMSPYNATNTASAAYFTCFNTAWTAAAQPSWVSFAALSS